MANNSNNTNDDSSSAADSNNIYEVSRILSQRKEQGVIKYLVEWIGYSVERASWEPIESFEDARGVLDDWRRRRRLERNGEVPSFDFEEWERLKTARKQRIEARRARDKEAARIRKQQTVKSIPAKPLQSRQRKNLTGFVVSDSESDIERSRKPSSRQASIPKKRLRKVETGTNEKAGSADRQDLPKAGQSRSQTPDAQKLNPKRPKQRSEEAVSSLQSSKGASFVGSSATLGKSKATAPQELPQKDPKKDTPLADVNTGSTGGVSGVARPTLPGALNANIFNNWTDQNKRKARSRPELVKEANSNSDLFGSLSERRRFEKFGQIDRLPKEQTQESSLDSLFVSSQENFDHPNFNLLLEGAADPPTSKPKEPSPMDDSLIKDSTIVRASAIPPVKIPLTCYKWFTPGERCPDVRNCRFLHEEGYRMSDPYGFIPQKFLNPPQTCWYWWNAKCSRNPDDCNFAHHNTGLIGAMPDGPGKTTVVDLSEVPVSKRKPLIHSTGESTAPDGQERAQNTNQRLTCWYWWNVRCLKSRYDCKYAHHTTGLVAGLSQSEGVPKTTNVDLDRVPPPSKYALTCPFWFRGYCRKSEQCHFSHYNTGWLAATTIGAPPVPVDLEAGPDPSSATNEAQTNAAIIPYNNSLRKTVICRFWKVGNCKFTAAECDYIHGPLDVISRPPDVVTTKTGRIHLELEELPDAPIPAELSPSPRLIAQAPLNEPAHTATAVQGTEMPNQRASPLLQASHQPSRILDVAILLPSAFGAVNEAATTSTPLPVKFHGLNDGAASTLLNLTEFRPEFTISTACLVDDWNSLAFQGETSVLASGSISPTATSSKDLTLLIDTLRAHGIYGVAFHSHFTVVFNPVVSDSQLFANPSALLAFQIVKPLLNHTTKLPQSIGEKFFDADVDTPFQTVFRARFGLTPEYVFESAGQSSIQMLDKQVFLIIDSTVHNNEALIWTSFFRDAGAAVYTSGSSGAWEYFVQNCKRSVVLIHRDVYLYDQIPSLHKVLARSVNVFKMEALDFELGCETPSMHRPLSRLFPSGSVILITDDLFAHHPNHAYDIMKVFQDRQFGKRKTTKIAGRPGLIPWLKEILEKALIKENGKPSKNSKIRSYIIGILERCVPPDKQHKLYPPNPSESSQLVSSPPEYDPTYDLLWKQNEHDATNRLVEWFAGWCIMQASTFRRFIVVHPVRNPEWTKKYQHIHVVTPEECIEKYLLRS